MHSIPRVVSVEDDPGIFELISRTLKSLPVELYHAGNGEEALALIADLHPDLLLLDISLPDIHGWDVLKQVKEMEGKQPKIIVLTAQTAPTHRVIGRLQNVTMYMFKPFMPAELRENICDVLELP